MTVPSPPSMPEHGQTNALPADGPSRPAFTRGPANGYVPVFVFNALLLGVLLCHALSHHARIVTDNLAECLGPLAASLWCLRGARGEASQGPSRWAATLLGLGILGYAVGQGIWTFYELALHRATPFPSWADAGYLGAYPFLFLGVLFLPTRPLPLAARLRALFDSLMIALALTTFSWYFVLGPTLMQSSETPLARAIGTAYPVADLALLCSALILACRAGDGTLRPVIVPLCLGCVSVIAVDSVFDYQTLHGTFETGRPIDIGWPLGYMLVAVAARAARKVSFTAPDPPAGSPRSRPATRSWIKKTLRRTEGTAVSLLPYAVVPAVGGLVWHTVRTHGDESLEPGVYTGGALLIVLLLLRQFLAVLENQRLVHQMGALNTTLEQTVAQRTEALAQQSRRTQLLLDAAGEGFFGIDTDGRNTFVNPAAAAMLGYTTEELMGLPMHATLHHTGADGNPVPFKDCPIYNTLSDGIGRRVAGEVFWRKDGTSFPVEFTATPMRDGQGRVVGSVVIFTDITERKRAGEALQREREFLGALLESLSDGIVACDETGALRLFSRSTQGLAEPSGDALTPEDDLAPEQWAEHFGLYQADTRTLMRPEDVPLYRALQGETVRDAPIAILQKGKPERHLLANGRTIRDGVGGKLGAVIAMRDVTESRAAEAALREREQHLRLALESGGLGSYLLDLVTSQFLSLSDACRAHFALSPGMQASRADFLALLHPDDRERVQAAFLRAIRGRGEYQAEYRAVRPDGEIRWISAHGRAVCDATGLPTRMVGVTQDITERKTQEAQQERALQEAREQADRDPLTGLWNHRTFHRRLEEEAGRAEREGTTLAVVVLDLDSFQFFNGAHGHVIGDEVLRLVAGRLQQICCPCDTVARFGGDEFALLMPGVGRMTADEVEARLRTDLGGLTHCWEEYGVAVPVTLSLGAALLSHRGPDRQGVLRQADERLRRVKSGGDAETEADNVRLSARASVADFSMLDALVTAVDNKDRYTCQHSEDVMAHSLLIARELGLSAERQKTVAVAALLHDVGKIGVPDAILRKPGKLTSEEYGAIQQHPTMGAAIISTVPGLEDTLDAVRHHHERWDGQGYPAGLKGDETPLMARLMAVADAFSAMTMDRPYRKGMDRDRALSILQAGAGSQWDPQCVAAFVEALASPGRVTGHRPFPVPSISS